MPTTWATMTSSRLVRQSEPYGTLSKLEKATKLAGLLKQAKKLSRGTPTLSRRTAYPLSERRVHRASFSRRPIGPQVTSTILLERKKESNSVDSEQVWYKPAGALSTQHHHWLLTNLQTYTLVVFRFFLLESHARHRTR